MIKGSLKKGLQSMKVTHMYKKNMQGLALLAVLCLLPSCTIIEWFKDKMGGTKTMTGSAAQHQSADMSGMTGDVLVTMNGKPLITVESLQAEKKELIASNPQLGSMLALIDEKQLDRNLAEGLASQAAVDHYITVNKINQTKEYQEEMERAIKSLKQMLNTKFFSQNFNVTVSDSDARDFYEKNKQSMPNLVISRGGTKAMGVKFEQEADAKNFLAKAKEVKGDLQKAATQANVAADQVKDFALVNEQSIGLDGALRDKIIALKTTPSTELIKLDDKTFWVISASAKEESKYRPYEQVQNDLKMYLEKEKRMEMFEQEINRLKNEYKVVIKEDYFKPDVATTQTQEVSEEVAPEASELETEVMKEAQKQEVKQARYA